MTAVDETALTGIGTSPELPSLHSFGPGAAEARRAFIEDVTAVDLGAITLAHITPEAVEGSNIENLLGEVSIPVGAVGPLTVRGQYADGRYYVPLATTEGTLVASVSRGVKTLNLSGGVETAVEYRGMTRSPVFVCDSLADAQRLKEFVSDPERFTEIAEVAEVGSNHTKLLEIKPISNDRFVWLRFRYDTDEAMGMNMATVATQQASDFIMSQVPCSILALSGNACVDKKANWINVIDGRGFDVEAAASIPAEVLEDMGVDPKYLADVGFVKNWVGGAMAGAMTNNAHAANMVSAVFAATGQDLAHVIESSHATTTVMAGEDGVRFAVKMPSVIAGTIGGGTGLDAQKSLMEVMLTDVDNPEKVVERRVRAYAEIVGATVLAGELNLLTALAQGQLASGHQKFGRSKQ